MNRLIRIRHRSSTDHPRSWRGQEGQSLLELSFGMIFLVLIVIILFEMTMLFFSYIALLNASREAASYASLYENLGCLDYAKYEDTALMEAEAAGLLTDDEHFEIETPMYGTETVSVTLNYHMVNPTQGIILPAFGRLGLFQDVWVSAAGYWPIVLNPACNP